MWWPLMLCVCVCVRACESARVNPEMVWRTLVGGALLTSGDRPPADLPLREDLRTRMGAGVVLRIEALSDEEKKAALSSHAHSRGIALAPDLLEYILERAVRDMGTQMTVIDLLDRLSLERKRPITMPLVREVLQLIEQSARNN